MIRDKLNNMSLLKGSVRAGMSRLVQIQERAFPEIYLKGKVISIDDPLADHVTTFVMCSCSQYESWCIENNISKFDKRYRQLSEPRQLRGFLNPVVIRYGAYMDLPHYVKLERVIAARTLIKG